MRIVLVVLMWIGAQILPTCADNLVWGADGRADIFPAAPASDLFSAEPLKKYREYLGNENCHDALILLNDAFVARYPQFPNATHGVPRDAITTHEDFRDWVTYLVQSRYPELHFCRMKKLFQKVVQEIKKRGLRVGLVYPGKTFIDENKKPDGYDSKSLMGDHNISLWRERDSSILSTAALALKDRIPAILFLTNLVRRGGFFRDKPDPEMEYFLLQRACHLGQNCRTFKHRIDELEKLISSGRAAALKAQSKQKKAARELIYEYVFKQKNL